MSGLFHVFWYEQLKEQLPSFDLGFMEGDEFREFYKFTFQFSREGTHRTIERDVAAPLLQMVSSCSRSCSVPFLPLANVNSLAIRLFWSEGTSYGVSCTCCCSSSLFLFFFLPWQVPVLLGLQFG